MMMLWPSVYVIYEWNIPVRGANATITIDIFLANSARDVFPKLWWLTRRVPKHTCPDCHNAWQKSLYTSFASA
jgi:hypothetical protein